MAGIKEALKGLVGSVTGGAIAPIVDTAKGLADIADQFLETKDEKREFILLGLEAQRAQNQTEAKHRSIFVAGWRPFIGWICGLGLFFYYPVRFAVATWLWARDVIGSGVLTDFPIDISDLMQLVIAMLGLAGYRTYEKSKGVAK